MLGKDDKIQLIVDREIDRMSIDDLRRFAEDQMLETLYGMLNEEVDDLFLEVMNGQKI